MAGSTDAEGIAERLLRSFERIQHERMQGLPILKSELCVAVVGGREWRGDWLGVLITPWCMNLVLVPLPGSVNRPGPIGSTLQVRFPVGEIDFIASEEDEIGPFAACSLFSPMMDFPDQRTAIETAGHILDALGGERNASQTAEASQAGSGRNLSRRGFLSGGRRAID